MSRAIATAQSAQVAQSTQSAETKREAELVTISSLPLMKYVTKSGEERIGIRLHNISYLPERAKDDGTIQPSRFGGFIPEWTDPKTGEVRGNLRDNSVPLQFFGHAADQLKAIITESFNQKRDAIILGVNGDPATLSASVHRKEDGSIYQLAVGTREFRGNHKKLIASPEADVKEE